MMETLYRHDPRGESFENLEATEYYQCRIDQESRERRHVFFVRETHGYFDDQQKKPANITETFNPEKPFENFAEAEGRFISNCSSAHQRASCMRFRLIRSLE
jgi:hypothetical protein